MITLTIGDLYDRAVKYYGAQAAVTYSEKSYWYTGMGDNALRLVSAFQNI